MTRTQRRNGLGRGLASLIPDSALELDGESGPSRALRQVPIDELDANPEQPRECFDPAELDALAQSIRTHGIMSPLLVRREEGRYILIAGERRLRAAALAGLTEVPVWVREVESAADSLELALVENLQRSDLDPIEAARGYQRLKEVYGYTQEEVARKVAKDRSTVANAMRLLKLPEFALKSLRDGQISAGHARALLPLAGDESDLKQTLARIVVRDLNVRKTEKLVAELTRVDATTRAMRRTRVEQTLTFATKVITRALKTAVEIKPRKRGGGRIVIQYADGEELDRLIDHLRQTQK
jgi:ParB family transcriptional regulator, chromosome partitioning protein